MPDQMSLRNLQYLMPLMPQQTNLPQATAEMNLSPQEQALYMRHVKNMYDPMGGLDAPDGSRMTLYQMGTNINGREYNIPTVHGGAVLSTDQAIAQAQREGINNFPSYATPQEADARYQRMHDFMERDTTDYFNTRRSGATLPPTVGKPGR